VNALGHIYHNEIYFINVALATSTSQSANVMEIDITFKNYSGMSSQCG